MEEKRSYKKCTVEELQSLLQDEGGFTMLPDNPIDEVYPGLYIADCQVAQNRFVLQNKGITHVLNVAKGNDSFSCNSDPELYEKLGIHLLQVEVSDNESFPIKSVFNETSKFIEEALAGGGQVVVHCRAGISRSSTVVLAFLMQKHNMSAQDAVCHVHQRRFICPNDGFLQQLCDLDEELALEREKVK